MVNIEIVYNLSNTEEVREKIDIRTQQLDLSNRAITHIDLSQLASLQFLNYLNLSNNLLPELDTSALSGNVYLETILLTNNRLENIDLSFVEHFPKLSHIDISKNRISSFKVLTRQPTCRIKELNLSFNELITISIDLLSSFVVNLDLSHNQLTNVSLAKQSRVCIIDSLDISHNSLDDLDLSNWQSFETLRCFNASNNPLTEIKLSSHPNLQDLRIVSTNTLTIDLDCLSGWTGLNHLELGQLPSNVNLVPLIYLSHIRSLSLQMETGSTLDLSPLFFMSHLVTIDVGGEPEIIVNWILQYHPKMPHFFEHIENIIEWDDRTRIDKVIPIDKCRELFHPLLRKSRQKKFENTVIAKLCCEIIQVLRSNNSMRQILKEKKLKKQLEQARRLKREALVASEKDTDRSLRRFLHEPTEKQRYSVLRYLQKHQKKEAIQKMDVWFSTVLTAFVAISIGLTLYYRVLFPDLLNTVLANLAIPSVIVSLFLPFLHSISKHRNRIDYRIAVGKIAYLYILNIVVVGFTIFAFSSIEEFLLIIRMSFDPLLVDLISLSLLLAFVFSWAHVAYVYVDMKSIKWLKQVFRPYRRIRRIKNEDRNCELDEIETFISVGSIYADVYYLMWVFTTVNLLFAWSTIKGRVLFDLPGEFELYFPIWQPIVIILIVILVWKSFLIAINGRKIQVQLVKRYSND